MMLKLLFAGCPATMDAYRARTRRCVGLFAALAVLGAATWLYGFFGVPELLPEGARRSYFYGFYTGMGTALAGCGLVLAVRTARLLKDEAALRKAFTRDTDERNRAIRRRAIQAAGVCLFAVLYAGVLVAGLFAPVLFGFCLAGVLGFALLYGLFYAYYNHKL